MFHELGKSVKRKPNFYFWTNLTNVMIGLTWFYKHEIEYINNTIVFVFVFVFTLILPLALVFVFVFAIYSCMLNFAIYSCMLQFIVVC